MNNMKDLDLLITLSPSMPHFSRFSIDNRINGIRINSAMMELDELDNEFKFIKDSLSSVPLWYDIKGRQLRIRQVGKKTDKLRIILNHKIEIETPIVVLFKGGNDHAVLEEVVETSDGKQVLTFKEGGPKFSVVPGESICIRDKSFVVLGETFPDYEIEKIKRVRESGLFNKYVLSYVESQRDIDQFRELVGTDCEIIAKIENLKGLNFVSSQWKPQKNVSLMAARGDLYIEIDKPHKILNAIKMIIEKDKNAMVGSRLLLSCVNKDVPDAVDFSELAWLYDIGYRKMLLCDDLCISESRLSLAINAFCAFRDDYAKDKTLKINNFNLSLFS